MIKRILYISFIVLLVGALLYFYLQVNSHSEQVESCNLTEVVPNNAGVIIEIPNLDEFRTNIDLESDMWNNVALLPEINNYIKQWQNCDSLAQKHPELTNWMHQPAIISYHMVGQGIKTFFAMKYNNKAIERAWQAMFTKNGLQKEKTYNGVKIFKSTNDGSYCYFSGGYFVKSQSSILLEQSIRNVQGEFVYDDNLEMLRKTKGNGADANIFVNYQRLHSMGDLHTIPRSSLLSRINQLGEWGEFDFNINKSNIILNGFSSYNADDYWQIFVNQESVKTNIQSAIPSDSKGFLTLSLANFQHFRDDYEKYLSHQGEINTYHKWLSTCKKRGITDIQLIFDQLVESEMAIRFDDNITSHTNESLLVMDTHSESTAKGILNDILKHYANVKGVSSSSFRSSIKVDSEITINAYRFPFDDIFGQLYGTAFSCIEANYYCFYNNHIFFASSKGVLKDAIMANILKQTYANDASFIDLFNSFSVKNSLFYFERTNNVVNHIEKHTSTDFCANKGISIDNFNNFYALAYQMVSANDYVYNSILFNYNANIKDKPLTVWNSQLEAKAVGKPTFVTNHYTQEKEICIQDKNNILYLISNSGRVIWKKPIGEKILSEIRQIDYYKNNKLQLLFNTASKLMLIDRDGNFVERYPVLIPSPATTGLSLFDYDNDRNYRIFIPTKDKHLYLYSKEGNINKGFTFGNTEYPLNMPVQFFRVNHKDYLVFSDKNHVYITDRKGKTRVKLKTQFAASNNNIFYLITGNKPYLAKTNTEGDLVKIYFDGSTSVVDLPNSSPEHHFALKDLVLKGQSSIVIVDKDKLNVYNLEGKLIYDKTIKDAHLSKPYFYGFSYNETKVGLFDQSNNDIYLLNGADGQEYKDFPLEGSTPFSIGFLNSSSWKFNLIVGGENNVLYNYKVK